MKTTNYANTFIRVSPDCPAKAGTVPPKPYSVAGLQYALLAAHPYRFTSDDLLFEVHARRNAVAAGGRAAARRAYFETSRACLRSSPLVKQYGWGLHHDADGRVAAYCVETDDYRRLASRRDLKIVSGMRSRRT